MYVLAYEANEFELHMHTFRGSHMCTYIQNFLSLILSIHIISTLIVLSSITKKGEIVRAIALIEGFGELMTNN